MSTLTALKLERELDITRIAMAFGDGRPKLEMRWALDAETGKAVAVWAAAPQTATVMALPELAFA